MAASTLNGNTAASFGGGIAADGSASYTNCTLSGNESGSLGGAIFQHRGIAVMLFTTIANNLSTAAGFSGGVHVATGTVSFQNTLLSNNAPLNCGGDPGELISLGNNIASDTSCAFAFTQPSDKNGVDAKLGPLASNGGPTLTHLPQAGSPAIDTAVMAGGVTIDQRGTMRPRGANPDIGSVEAQ